MSDREQNHETWRETHQDIMTLRACMRGYLPLVNTDWGKHWPNNCYFYPKRDCAGWNEGGTCSRNLELIPEGKDDMEDSGPDEPVSELDLVYVDAVAERIAVKLRETMISSVLPASFVTGLAESMKKYGYQNDYQNYTLVPIGPYGFYAKWTIKPNGELLLELSDITQSPVWQGRFTGPTV